MLALPVAAVPMIEYTEGHADIGVAYEEDGLFLHYHFHAGAVLNGVELDDEAEYEPEEIYTRVASSQLVARPAGSQWDFIGTSAGGDMWYLPQVQETGVPFLGSGAEETNPDDWTPNSFSYTITAVSRPAGSHFSIWQSDIFGDPIVLAATSDGLPDTLSVPSGSHSHYNWGFTAEGIYQVQITATGTHLLDGPVSDSGTFWFAVGNAVVPEPSSLMIFGISFGLFFLKRRRATQ
jgi:surface-anchored protein